MKNKSLIYQFSQHLFSVSISFILILLALTLYDYYTSKEILPNTDQYIQELKLQLDKTPDNKELVSLIRNLDFVYRKGWFEQKERLDLGVKLILIGLGALLLSVALIFSMRKNLPNLKEVEATRTHHQARLYYVTILTFLGIGLTYFVIHFINISFKTSSTELTTQEEKTNYLQESTHQWSSFRGGVLPTEQNLPSKFDLKERWKINIPLKGFSSPVIWNEKLFLTGADKKQRTLFCYDIASGNLLWQINTNAVAQLPEVSDDTGYAAPTCAVNEKYVYAIFATGQVICVDHEGKKKWEQLLPKLETLYGYASSLLLTNHSLIIQQDGDNHQSVFSLDPITGKTMWRAQREALAGWSSPILVEYEGKEIIFTSNNQAAEAFDAIDGKSLWRKNCLGGEVASTAYYADSYIYFANQGAIATAFHPLTGEQLFTVENIPMPDVCSPITYQNMLLLLTSGGSVLVLDAKTGKEKYEHFFESGFYASPLLIDNKILTINMQGDLLLSSPDQEKWNILGEYKVGKNVVATPAIKNKMIFLRTFDNELIALEEKP